MTQDKVNVLVYADHGTTKESVRHCLLTLTHLLSPNYAVIPLSAQVLLHEPWQPTCALFVMPGGADLGYCRTLNGQGNRRISEYVNRGGSYLGLCAGGYYGSKRCEFELDDPKMAVAGDRELAFFPGTCRGAAFREFVYHSEAGARAVRLNVDQTRFSAEAGVVPSTFHSYYNGGGVFVDSSSYADQGVEILASYAHDLDVDSGRDRAAIVYRRAGEGHVILTGPHPEFAASNLDAQKHIAGYDRLLQTLETDDRPRSDFVKACLGRLGLKVNTQNVTQPALSSIHLSSSDKVHVKAITKSWANTLDIHDGTTYLQGEHDAFAIDRPDALTLSTLEATLPSVVTNAVHGVLDTLKSLAVTEQSGQVTVTAHTSNNGQDRAIDYDSAVKKLVLHESDLPSKVDTPYFDHKAYFAALAEINDDMNTHARPDSANSFGQTLLYGEVVTSTNTLLEKNPTLLKHLPRGTTMTATTQVAGRGRGSNVWVSPPGSLMFSTLIHHSLSVCEAAPVVFIQYLAAMAVVDGIHQYGPGYDTLPIRLKWPNDIYALDPKIDDYTTTKSDKPMSEDQRRCYVKIGGILVNSSYMAATSGVEGGYTLVCGVGLNLSNPAPTTSLNSIISQHYPHLEPLRLEKLLASILVSFEALYNIFCGLEPCTSTSISTSISDSIPFESNKNPKAGFSKDLQKAYYDTWLHTDQIVTLEQHGHKRAKIVGISDDWGMLLAREILDSDRMGDVVTLQSDSNSFDFFKGLLKKKI